MLGAFLALGPAVAPAPAQVPDSTQTATGLDSLTVPPADSLQPALESIPEPAALGAGNGGRVIKFSATDTLILDLGEGRQIAQLRGASKANVEAVALEAYAIDLLLEESELRARGLPVDTGVVGPPRFMQGSESFSGSSFAYNLNTQKGRVVQARTAIEDGYISGRVTKVLPDSVLFVAGALYTTCLVDTSYSLRTNKMKIAKSGQRIYTGPIHLRIFNIPLPFWLPFGVLPPPQASRKSGPLAPNYGEDPERGFYLRDFGWYFPISDYMDFQIQFGIWTLGSWQVNPQYRYNKRYLYSGQVALDWVKNSSGERGDPPAFRSQATTRSFRWRHNQTVNPTTDFTADVNLTSSNYLRTVSRNYNDQVRQTIESNINFSKRWLDAGRTATLYASHRQLLTTGEVTSTLPRFRFTQRSRNPFQRAVRSSSGERWYEKITYSYNAQLDNQYTFRPDTTLPGAAEISWFEALVSGEKYRQATGETEPFRFKATHQLPVSAAFSVQRIPVINKIVRLNLTPNINYEENWFIQTDERFINEETGRVETRSVPGFKSVRVFSTGVGANTEFYGQFPLRIGRFEGLRHVVRPTVSFSYQPDFSTSGWGYYRTYVDTNGVEIPYPLITGIPELQAGEQRRMSLTLNNVFQTKSVRIDSTGEADRKTVQVLTLNMGTSYNFAADSLHIAPVTLSARTRVLNQFDFNLTSNFSPYVADARGQSIQRLYLAETGKPLRLRSLNFTTRTSISSKRRTGESRPFENDGNLYDNSNNRFDLPGTEFFDPLGATGFGSGLGYTDFAIPWSLDLDFTYNWSKTGPQVNRRAIMNAGFDFNLTPNWKIRGRTGFDFVDREVVTTSVNILRDLHCWEMSLSWTPFGTYQSFQFSLNIKSGKLREYLRLRHPRSDIRNRFDLLN